MSENVSHCHTVTNKYIKNMSRKKVLLYRGMLCVSFKIGNTFNPEKSQVEVRKRLSLRFNFGN